MPAGKLPCPEGRVQRLRSDKRSQRLDRIAEDHEERYDPISNVDEHFTARRRTAAPDRRDTRNLLRRQCRKEVLRERCAWGLRRRRGIGYRHDITSLVRERLYLVAVSEHFVADDRDG